MQRFFSLGGHSILVGMLMAAIVMAPGCSLFIPKQQAISIRSNDPSAKLLVDGTEVGTGSTSVMLDRTKSHTVVAKAASGRSGAVAIQRKISGYGIADIIGGVFLLVPLLGLLGPGFWELEPENVNVIIE